MSPEYCILSGMARLTEIEVIDCLKDNLRKLVQHCKDLAEKPAQGPTYKQVIETVRLVEGASRQMAAFRSDARWTKFGYEMARFHDRLGDCVRSRYSREIFRRMSTMVADAYAQAMVLYTAKTGRRGPILPKVLPGPHRETRPVGYTKTDGGLLMPV